MVWLTHRMIDIVTGLVAMQTGDVVTRANEGVAEGVAVLSSVEVATSNDASVTNGSCAVK